MKITAFTKSYGQSVVLDFPGIELERGKIYAVIGANGSGKSTFAKVLSGITKPDHSCTVHDCRSLGYMPQKNYAFRMSAERNILLNGVDKDRAARLMESMRISHLKGKAGHRLSGGETARMALVRLMMRSYDVLVLDEPTAAMDMESSLLAESMMLDYVKENGCTMILVTHSLQQAKRIADEIIYFHQGKLVEAGDKNILLTNPAKAQTKRFLEFYGL